MGGPEFEPQNLCKKRTWWCVFIILVLEKQRQKAPMSLLSSQPNQWARGPHERLCLKKLGEQHLRNNLSLTSMHTSACAPKYTWPLSHTHTQHRSVLSFMFEGNNGKKKKWTELKEVTCVEADYSSMLSDRERATSMWKILIFTIKWGSYMTIQVTFCSLASLAVYGARER